MVTLFTSNSSWHHVQGEGKEEKEEKERREAGVPIAHLEEYACSMRGAESRFHCAARTGLAKPPMSTGRDQLLSGQRAG